METRVIDGLMGRRFALYGAATSLEDVLSQVAEHDLTAWLYVANPVPEGLADSLAAKGVAFQHVPIEVSGMRRRVARGSCAGPQATRVVHQF